MSDEGDRLKGSSVDSFLRRVFNRIPVGLYRTTPDGRIVHANLALARMLGYERVEDLKKRDLEADGYEPFFLSSDFRRRIEEVGRINGLDARWQKVDGSFIDVREYADVVRDGSGAVLFYDGAAEDITGFKRTEESLMQSELRYRRDYAMFRLMADNMQDMLWAKDTRKRYIFANRAICEKLLNASDTDEPVGKTDMFFAERERKAYPLDPEWHTFGEICADSDSDVIRSRKPGRFEEFGNVHGQFMFLDVNKSPLFDEDRKFLGTVGSARIVTREKELESWNKRTKKALEDAFSRLRSTQESTLRVMAKLVETRDAYTSGHQGRVTRLATAIALDLDLDEEKKEGLRVASLVHDIGKLRIPVEILSKPGHLEGIEMELIREHPQSGFDILSEIDFSWPVEDIILQHHERMDGSGYLRGLSGEDILIEARILAVADVVEAMSADRPYRPSLGIEVALNEIRAGRGRLYDPEVVSVCCGLFEEGRFGF